MIRSGARAPQPPPLPPSPTAPKPGHHRDFEQTKERLLLHRVRQTENLREKIVKLARRQEERNEQGEVVAGLRSEESSLVQHRNVQGEAVSGQPLEHAGVEVIVFDMKKGDGGARAAGARNVTTEDGKTTFGGLKGWKRVTLTNLNSGSLPDTRADHPTQVIGAETQRPPPDSPPFPRSAAHRLRLSPQQVPSATNSVHQTQIPNSPLRDPSTRASRDPQPKGEGHEILTTAKPTTTTTTTTTTLGKTTPRSLRTPSRIVLNQGPSDVQNVQDQSLSSGSPRSQEVHRQPRSPPDPQPRPGQGSNYRRAARLLQANMQKPAGQLPAEPHKRVRVPLGQERRGPRPKSVKVRAEECSSHYQSSGSSGDSPRQTSRGVEEVGGVRGNAVPSSPHRLHAPLSPSRQHSKNPSNFASSLEMFKRRLKMNHSKLTKEDPEVEEDYIIRLADTVPIARPTHGQPVSYEIHPHPPDTPAHLPPHPPSHHPLQPPLQRRPLKQSLPHPPPLQELDLDVEDKHGHHLKTEPAADGLKDARLANWDKRLADWDKGFGDWDKGLGDWDKGLEDWDKGLGVRSAGDGQEAGDEAGEEDEDHDVTVSCRVPDSADDPPFVLLGEAERAPLPQVKTYVVQEDVSRNVQGRSHDLPLALTQHNVTMHNTFLQRRLERERQRQRRVELEKKVGLASAAAAAAGGGGGRWVGCSTDNLDVESRMRRWLSDTEQQQRDFQPLINLKVAIPIA